jgi:hypothetical protein
MEQQLTNVEIIRVFAMYIECEIISTDIDNEMRKGYLTGIQDMEYAEIQFIYGQHAAEDPEYKLISNVNLLLTPLSKITDDHAIEVAKIESKDFMERDILKGKYLYHKSSGGCTWHNNNYIHTLHYNRLTARQFQYLIQQSYAVPLFFGLNHPCNSNDAIELGIAIDKTKFNL